MAHDWADVASIAAGVDGLIIEVHLNPARTLSDGPCSCLRPRTIATSWRAQKRRFMAEEKIAPMVME